MKIEINLKNVNDETEAVIIGAALDQIANNLNRKSLSILADLSKKSKVNAALEKNASKLKLFL